MSFYNLATVFGPTLLRPSEKDSKISVGSSQPISMNDNWSLEVMSQVRFKQLHSITWLPNGMNAIYWSNPIGMYFKLLVQKLKGNILTCVFFHNQAV